MQVLFLKDVTGVAQAGEVREVSDGYARNYLIPQGLAAQATPDQLKRIQKLKKMAEEQRLRQVKELEDLAKALEGVSVTLKGKVAPTGKYYGAISSIQVADALAKITGREIERRLVELKEPIHEPGTYTAVVRLHPEISSNITVVAEKEE